MQQLKIIFASNNKTKIDHYRYLEEELGIKFDQSITIPNVEETGSTYKENAELKALSISLDYPDYYIISEDSGIEIPAIGNKPGIYSHRLFGDRSYPEKIDLLYSMLTPWDSDDLVLQIHVVVYKAGQKIMDHHITRNYKIPTPKEYARRPEGHRSFGYNAFKKLPDGRLLAEISEEDFLREYNPRREKNLIEKVKAALTKS
jgi:inosine/xanthosine triphosphate pyrophosphatase family protein